MMRAVVDTNILIRAFIKPTGSVGPVLARLRAGGYELVYSQPLLAELARILLKPHIRLRYDLDHTAIETFLAFIAGRGMVVIPERRINACRDVADDMVLEAAVAGQVAYIVTGDEDLLVMRQYEGIEIVPPHVFLARLDSQRR